MFRYQSTTSMSTSWRTSTDRLGLVRLEPAWLRPSLSAVGLALLLPLSWPFQLQGPTSPALVAVGLVRPVRRPKLAQQVACPWTVLSLLLAQLLLLAELLLLWLQLLSQLLLLWLLFVEPFALDLVGCWALFWPLSDVLAGSCLE